MKKWMCLFLTFTTLQALPRVPVQQVVDFNDQFTLDVYRILSKNQGNILVSPYAVSSAFAIAYLGSAGDTTKEIGRVLRFPLNPTYLAPSFKRINEALSSDKNLVLLSSLWADRSARIDDFFRKSVDDNFPGLFNTLDFQLRTDSARSEINSWVAARTFKKIPSYLSVSDVSAATKMLMVASLSLQTSWAKPFNLRETTTQKFFPNKRSERSVTMMSRVDEYPYTEDDNVKVCEIPYTTAKSEEARLSLYIILPKDVEGLKAVEESLGPEMLGNWITQVSATQVSVKMPRFRVNQTHSFKEIFDKMSLKNPFTNEADFSLITGDNSLFISKIVQKIYFNVDERGSDSREPVSVDRAQAPIQSSEGVKDFVVDRPFLFFVIDNNLNQIIMIGRILQP